MSYNYLAIKVNGVKMDLHRYVWEQAYGEIPEGYVIHHIDGNKHNNDLSNLQMMTYKEHNALHGHNKNPKDMTPEEYAKWYEAVVEANKKRAISIIDGKKKCSKCHESLPLEAFYKDKSTSSGYSTMCRKCRSKLRKKTKPVK